MKVDVEGPDCLLPSENHQSCRYIAGFTVMYEKHLRFRSAGGHEESYDYRYQGCGNRHQCPQSTPGSPCQACFSTSSLLVESGLLLSGRDGSVEKLKLSGVQLNGARLGAHLVLAQARSRDQVFRVSFGSFPVFDGSDERGMA